MNRQIAEKMWDLLPDEERKQLLQEFGCTAKILWIVHTEKSYLTPEGELLKIEAEKIIQGDRING